MGSTLSPLVKTQALAEGVDENELLVDLVTQHWPSWSTRGPLPEAAAVILSTRRGGYVNLRVPEATAVEIFAEAEAGEGYATDIVAELIARYLPERIERLGSPTKPKQERFAFSA